MGVLLLLMPILLITVPPMASQKKVQVSNKVEEVQEKRKRYYVRYPVRVNIMVNSDKLKIQDMIKDLNE